MKLDYFLFYAEANIVCIIVMVIMLLNDRAHGTRQEKQLCFNNTVNAHILYFLSDICWAGVLSGQIAKTRLSVALFNFLDYIFLSLMAYEWLMYMSASESMSLHADRRKRRLCCLPMAVSVLALIIVYAVKPAFLVSEAGELTQLYFVMMIAAPLFYILASFIYSVLNAKKASNPDQKKICLLIGIYPLSIVLFGLIQTFALNAPLFCFGCTIMLIFFYIQNLQTMVSIDSLTRLNNRGQVNRYMEQTHFRENMDIYAVMIDINGFKKINDTYGHAAGDRALLLTADVLKQTVQKLKNPAFIGRYGGDEFAMFMHTDEGEEKVKETLALIQQKLNEGRQELGLPFEMVLCTGYDVLRDKEDTLAACLNRADEKLYQFKRKS